MVIESKKKLPMCEEIKKKPPAFQIGWLQARDGGRQETLNIDAKTLKQYSEGYLAYQEVSQVHLPG
jgi:hypothetical protein